MARKRKTVEIDKLVRMANHYFLHTSDEYREGRKAIQSFVSGVLSDTDTYKGFRYLTKGEMQPGMSYGIEFRANDPRGHLYPDDSRIQFSC